MNCCGKTMDGLDGDSQGGTFDGDVIITGDLNVQGGQLDLGVGPDGWSNIRSNDAAFGLDLEAPAGKRIRLINDITPIVEIDTNLNLIGSSGSVGLVPAPSTTTYDFVLPIDLGINTQVLTTTGTSTYWSAGGGIGGGTVTSVGFDVSGTPFLTISPPTITTAGVFSLTFSGTPLDVANGGTGVTTATGTGSVVRANTPILITPIIGNALGTSLKLFGSGNGDVIIIPNATGSSWSFILPTTAGLNNQVLTSSGGGLMTWTTPAPPGTGTVTSVGIIPPSFLLASAAITTSGNITLSYNPAQPLPIANGGTSTNTATGSGAVVLQLSPIITGTLTAVAITASGIITFTNTTNSTNSTNGGLIIASGVGIAQNLNVGGTITTPNFAGSGSVTTTGVLSTTNATASTSTTTGSFVIGGGAGIGGDLFVKQSVNVNFGGSIGSPQLRVSPATNNNVATMAFYTGVSNTGSSWLVGHAGGAGNFSIFHSTSGTKFFSTPTGPATFPSGSSTTTFLDFTGSTSGTVSIRVQPVAVTAGGTYNFNLPIDAGAPNQVLTSQGGGATAMTWTTPTTGTVTSVGLFIDPATTPFKVTLGSSPVTTTGTLALEYSGVPLPVLNGGTGVTTKTGTTSVVLSTSPTITTPTFINPVTNAIGIAGSSSGVVSIIPQPLFTSYNFNLPTTAGTAGQVLTSQGGLTNAMTWTNVGTGSVTSVGLFIDPATTPFKVTPGTSPVVSSGTLTLEYSGVPLPIANGGTATTTKTGTLGSSVVLQDSPTITGTLTVTNITGSGNIQMNSTAALSGTPLHQFSTNNASNGYIASFLNPAMPANGGLNIMFGRAAGEAAVLGYSRGGTNPQNFNIQFFGGSGSSIEVFQNNTASTTTATGALVVKGTGGLGVGGAVNVGGSITAAGGNLSAPLSVTSTSGGIKLSPTIAGNERSLNFYNGPNATGGVWAMGVGIVTPGDTFSLYNANFAANIFTIGYTTGLVTLKSLSVTDTTASSSTTTGSGIYAGGLGVAGAINSGGPLTVTTNTTGSPTLLTNSFINTNNTVGPFINGQLFPNVPTNSNMYIANGIATTTNNSALLGFHPRPGGNYGSLSIYGGSEIQYFSNGNITTPGAITASSYNSGSATFKYSEGTYSFTVLSLISNGSITSDVGSATWVKIGKMVMVKFTSSYAYTSSAPSANWNPFQMTLPFVASERSVAVLSNNADLDIGGTGLGSQPSFIECFSGQSFARLFKSNNEFNYLTPATPGFANYSGTFFGTLTYHTDSTA